VDRIRSFDPKVKIIGEFDMAAHRHWLYAMVEFVQSTILVQRMNSTWNGSKTAKLAAR